MVLRKGIDVCIGGFLKGEAAVFKRADDLAAGFRRDENVIGEIGCDEEDGAGYYQSLQHGYDFLVVKTIDSDYDREL